MGCGFSSNKNKTDKIFLKDNQNNLYNLQYWRNRDECCICLDNKCNILLLPCNHFVICDICCKEIYGNKTCPVCQEEVYSYNFLQVISAIPK